MKAFEEKHYKFGTKELKSSNSPVEPLLPPETISEILNTRNSLFERVKETEIRKTISRSKTESDPTPANFVNSEQIPTFNPLQNTNFNSRISHLSNFKMIVSCILIQHRVSTRLQQLSQYLSTISTDFFETLQNSSYEKSVFNFHSLLSLKISCLRSFPKSFNPSTMDSLPTEPPNIEAYQISRPFPLYSPDFVEQYQLSSFSRTDTTTFIAAPIAPPEKFPYVKEEQPIFERVPSNNEFPEKEKEKEKEKEIQQKITNSHSTKSFCSLSFTFSNILNYPRSTQYYSFDPSYSLIPQIMEFPDLQNEIGKSSILSLPTLEEYEKVSISKSSCVAPFAFAGVPDFFLSEMSGPESIDLKELENDDDVDGIDVTIKTRPIGDFLTKPLPQKNRSHVLAEVVDKQQNEMKDKQTKGIQNVVNGIQEINKMIQEKSLKIPLDDIQSCLN